MNIYCCSLDNVDTVDYGEHDDENTDVSIDAMKHVAKELDIDGAHPRHDPHHPVTAAFVQ